MANDTAPLASHQPHKIFTNVRELLTEFLL